MDHALDSLFREQAWLRTLARSLVRDDAEAEELVQETWLAALRNPPASPENPRPWLRVVVRRLAARQRSRWETELTEPDAHIAEGELPEDVAARWESNGLLRAAIDDLPGAERTVVLLRYQEGHSLEEIAEMLAVSPRTVSERLRAAKDRLRIRLGDRYEGEDGAGPPAWLAALAPLVDPEEWVASVRLATGGASPVPGVATGGVLSGGTLVARLAGVGTLARVLGVGLALLLGLWWVPAWLRQTPPDPLPAHLPTSPSASPTASPTGAGSEAAAATLRTDAGGGPTARAVPSAPETRPGAAPAVAAEPARSLRVDLVVETAVGDPLLDYRVRAVASEDGTSIAGASTPLGLGGEAQLRILPAAGSAGIALLLEPVRKAGEPFARPTFRLELDPGELRESTRLPLRLERGDLDVDRASLPRGPADPDRPIDLRHLPTVVVRRTLTEWPQPVGALGPWTARAQAGFRDGVASFRDLPCGTYEVEVESGDGRPEPAGDVVVLPD